MGAIEDEPAEGSHGLANRGLSTGSRLSSTRKRGRVTENDGLYRYPLEFLRIIAAEK